MFNITVLSLLMGKAHFYDIGMTCQNHGTKIMVPKSRYQFSFHFNSNLENISQYWQYWLIVPKWWTGLSRNQIWLFNRLLLRPWNTTTTILKIINRFEWLGCLLKFKIITTKFFCDFDDKNSRLVTDYLVD